MKTRAKVVAWLWMALSVVGMAQGVVLYLRPVSENLAWMHSPVMLVITGAWWLFMLFSAVALLRGRRWAWWVAVISSVVGSISTLGYLDTVTSGKFGPPEPWPLWSSLLSGALCALVLVGLLLDPPPRAGDEEGGTGQPGRGAELRASTLLIAWFWIVSMTGGALLSVVGMFWPGGSVSPGLLALLIAGASVLFCALVAASGVALLRRRASAWWTLVILSGLATLSSLPQHKYATISLFALSLVGLLFDPPSRWRPTELPPEPTPPEDLTPGDTDSSGAPEA